MATGKFLLISTPRAGTHMVRSTLDQHPDVACYGEVFHPMRDRWYPECIGMSLGQVEQWMLEMSSSARVGFAIQIGDHATAQTQEYWAQSVHDATIPIIYVMRRNQLRQTLSHYRSRLAHEVGGGGFMSYREGAEGHSRFGWTVQGLEEVRPLEINCHEFHELTVAREASEVAFFAKHRFQRICPVAYEDFVDDPAGELKRMTDFLEVDAFAAAPQTEKTGEGPWRVFIANFDEFSEYFSRTPYRLCLNDDAV